MLYGTVPFKANTMDELHSLIVGGKYNTDKTVSAAANHLLSQLIKSDPKKRIPIEEILNHQWFNQYDDSIELLNAEEKNSIKKDFFREHKTKEEDESIFTEYNLDATSKELGQNVSSKSIILAPFNTTDDKSETSIIDKSIIGKDRLIFSSKVRELNRQYERNNNCELDIGIYKDVSKPKKGSVSKPQRECVSTPSELNLRRTIPLFTMPKPLMINEEVCKKMECFGFPHNVIVESLKANEMNHATATYFLLLDEKVAH